ncbi:MAG TPA: class I SAM-dependent methyltransferase [Candidatus Limnocylindria bacterium]|nr:class I SAM-dependent methyltransferase [Candidatus Limnocylindria bacterium]
MTSPWRALSGSRPGKWSVWKFNWLANHKIIRVLERARRHAHGVLLDVGCGSKAFAPHLQGHVTRYIGVDLMAPAGFDPRTRGPDALGRAEALPIRDQSVDTVLGLSMLTYLTDPVRMLEEAHRVLRPGGTLILEFTQMAPLHDPPHDYFRFTRYGAAHLLERADFEPIEFLEIGGLWSRAGLTTIAGINRLNRGPTRVLTEIPARVLYVVLQLGFEGLDRMFFDRDEVLAHLIVARRREALQPAPTSPGSSPPPPPGPWSSPLIGPSSSPTRPIA